jgi:cobalt-zinc-cadmium efflux system membrane fusion protein
MSANNFLRGTVYLLIVMVFFSCNRKNKSESETRDAENLPEDVVEMRYDQVKMANIDTGTIEMRSINSTLKVNGRISVAPQNFATICAPLGGFVRSTSLLPGNSVRKGQVLAMVENQEYVDIQQSYLEAKSRLEYAEAEYRRHSDLYKEDVYSEKNLQQVTADYKSLKATVTAYAQKLGLIGINPTELSEENISRSVAITAPISGYVKSVNVNVGKSISATDILFEIVNNDNLFLELTLFEKDINKVSDGQKIRFYINNEEEEHEAVIYQTGKSVDADKTYKVYAKVTRGCGNLMPGMYVNALIRTSGSDVTALPSGAVVSFDDKDYIFTFLRNKKEKGLDFTEYRMVQIQKGISEEGYTEVRLPAGFDAKNTRVVIRGAYSLLSAKKNAGEMAC